jgi:hypothetical protein
MILGEREEERMFSHERTIRAADAFEWKAFGAFMRS